MFPCYANKTGASLLGRIMACLIAQRFAVLFSFSEGRAAGVWGLGCRPSRQLAMLTFQVSCSLGHQHSSTELRPQDCSVIYLDPLWELWRQFRLWPGPALMWTCPESLQRLKPDPSQLQDHLLPFQMFPRHRPLGSGQQRYNSMVCAATRFQLFFISHRTLRAQLLLLKSLLQHHSSKASILPHSAFFTFQLSHPYMTT